MVIRNFRKKETRHKNCKKGNKIKAYHLAPEQTIKSHKTEKPSNKLNMCCDINLSRDE